MGGKEMKHQMFPKEKLWIKCVIHSWRTKTPVHLWTTVDNLVEKSIFL